MGLSSEIEVGAMENYSAISCGTAVLRQTEHARHQLLSEPQIDLLADITHAKKLIPIIETEPADVPAGRSDINLQVWSAAAPARKLVPDCES